MASITWDDEFAGIYDTVYAWQSAPSVLDPAGDLLHSAPYRYVWPSELDLMARLAGFRLSDRWAGWNRSAFTASSTSQIAVYEKMA